MSVSLIRLDARVIGIASATPGDQGLGVLTWFHHNKAAYSMDHAIKHEGYSVDAPADLDCGDVDSIIVAICERAGVTMESVFVPFSQSRNAKADGMGGDKPWRSLNWQVTFKRGGREILTTEYAQGEGHAPASKSSLWSKNSHMKRRALDIEIETGFAAISESWGSGEPRQGRTEKARIPAPSIGDVMQSLARDSDVLDSGGFEEWASEYGYDADSRKAESTYRACVEIATKLRAALGGHLLDEIRLAASFN